MAQTGYTPILIYSSSTASNVPSASNLTNSTLGSELAINITDGKLFYKDNGGSVQVIGWKTVPTSAGGTGLTSYTAGDTLYYTSGTTLSKLGIGASKTIMTSSGSAPQWSASLDTSQGGTGLTSYAAGDLPYYATGTSLSKLTIGSANYVLTSSGTAPQWTAQSSLSVGTANNLKSNATTGVMQIVGPAAAATRVMTIPDANFTAARTDAAQTFTGTQTISSGNVILGTASSWADTGRIEIPDNKSITSKGATLFEVGSNFYINSGYKYAATGRASNYTQGAGYHKWYGTSTSGNAGDALTLTQYMAIDAFGGVNIAVGDLTMAAGNIIQGTASKGFNFTANTGAAGKTSQLLNWYEEGTWTPTVTAGSGTITTVSGASGKYTRIGRAVSINCTFVITTNGTGASYLIVDGLPFTVSNAVPSTGYNASSALTLTGTFGASSTQFNLFKYDGTYPGASGATYFCSGVYYV